LRRPELDSERQAIIGRAQNGAQEQNSQSLVCSPCAEAPWKRNALETTTPDFDFMRRTKCKA
jgi:hypothetical protein